VSAKATTAAHAAHVAHAAGIALPHIRYLAILPELVMLGGAVGLLGLSALVRRTLRPTVVTGTTVVVSLTAFGLAWWQWVDVADHGTFTAIAHAVVVDGFSSLVVILVSAAMALSALVADAWVRREGSSGPEMHVLAMVSASGAMIMAAANDLVLVFLGLEILSIALYVLAALNHRRAASGEAALKYFILGGFSSAIFVYGIALTYGATGTTNLAQIADFLSKSVILSDGVLLAGLSLLLVGFGFKVAAVPFHMWTPDVYQGSPSPMTGFMAAVAKVGGFAALLRVFVSSFGVLRADWQPVVYALAVLTLLVGAGLAVVQRDIKRMLAYSSINHAGFILLGLQAANAAGVSAALYYLFTYTFMVIGTFAVVTVLGRRGDADHDIAGYRGLAARQPFLAFAFAVLLLAQAGVPFTTGFLAKLQVVAAAVDVHSVPLAVIAMASAALAAFFYLRVAVLMYTPVRPAALPAGEEAPAGSLGAFGSAVPGPLAVQADGAPGAAASITRLNAGLLLDDAPIEAVADDLVGEPPDERSAVKVPVGIAVAIGVCLAVTVVFGIIPAPLVDFAHKATLLFLP
jgi:NADH-quinone oxidoreductase subunit N